MNGTAYSDAACGGQGLKHATTVAERIAELRDIRLSHRYEGIPLGAELKLGEIRRQQWNVARGDLRLPVTTLTESSVAHNVATLAAYCRQQGVDLCPHGKTTMAPQIFARQLQAGAWGMTAATLDQAAVMRAFGISRILLANQLVDAKGVGWIVAEMNRDPSFRFYCLVDDADQARWLDAALAESGVRRQMFVLLEVGMRGGRAGVRSAHGAITVAEVVRDSRSLSLAGVEAYEGLAASGGDTRDLQAVDGFLNRVRAVVRALSDRDLFHDAEVILSAGGSAYFDRVIGVLGPLLHQESRVSRLVLRSGCYVTHDMGKYHRLSPLDGRQAEDESLRLENALTAWARVLSQPEAGLAILDVGKRNVPYDVDLPRPTTLVRADGSRLDLGGRSDIFRLMDQHAFLSYDPAVNLAAGDIVAMGLSHPCTAFDKLKLLPVIDDADTVVDGVLTYF